MPSEQFFRELIVSETECTKAQLLSCTGALKYMQDTASAQMKAQKPSYQDLLDRGQALMVSTIDAAFYEEVKSGDILIASSWPCESKGAGLKRCYSLHKDGKLVAEASSVWELVDFRERKILMPEPSDFANYWQGPYKDAVSEKRFRISKEFAPGLSLIGEKTVSEDDCDSNKHMNNVKSLKNLCDFLSKLTEGSFEVKSFRLHFINEALLGELLKIMAIKTGPNQFLFRTIKSDGRTNIEAEINLK